MRVSMPKPKATFRTIKEVANEINVTKHTLRSWEAKFQQVRPLKRARRRRYYSSEDVALLRRIRDLLYNDGFTPEGVQKLLIEHGTQHVTSVLIAEVDSTRYTNISASQKPEKMGVVKNHVISSVAEITPSECESELKDILNVVPIGWQAIDDKKQSWKLCSQDNLKLTLKEIVADLEAVKLKLTKAISNGD